MSSGSGSMHWEFDGKQSGNHSLCSHRIYTADG